MRFVVKLRFKYEVLVIQRKSCISISERWKACQHCPLHLWYVNTGCGMIIWQCQMTLLVVLFVLNIFLNIWDTTVSKTYCNTEWIKSFFLFYIPKEFCKCLYLWKYKEYLANMKISPWKQQQKKIKQNKNSKKSFFN